MTEIPPPWQFGFFWMALAAVGQAAIVAGLVGPHLVVRRLALAGDALAHALLPGLVIATAWNVAPMLGALAAALVAGGLSLLLGRRRIREDSALAIVLTGLFALGILLMSLLGESRDFHGFLFGNLLGITGWDLGLGGILVLVVAAVALPLHKELELAALDATFARQCGFAPERLQLTVYAMLALAVAVSSQTVGVLLTSALLIIPGATANLFASTLRGIILGAIALALLAGIGGAFASYYIDAPLGATVVGVAVMFFLLGRVVRR